LQFGQFGWCALLIPEQYGGLGLSLNHMTVILEELGKSLLPEPLVPVSVLSSLLISGCDNETLKKSLLPSLSTGKLIVSTAWQETPWIQDRNSLEINNNKKLTLTGKKRFFRPGNQFDGILVTTGQAEGTRIIWIPNNSPAVSFTYERGADGTPFGVATFDNYPISEDAILSTGNDAEKLLLSSLNAATIATSAELLGLMQGAFELTLNYLSARTQFGNKIGSYQALQHRLVDLYIQIRLSSSCVSEAALRYSTDPKSGTSSAIASRAKARCSDAALQITREAVQMHGAIGFTDEHDIGQYLNRSFVLSAWLGNSAEHRRRYSEYSEIE
jgi:alkylation response protein AidB-like acyl-CoA dehydrogenase